MATYFEVCFEEVCDRIFKDVPEDDAEALWRMTQVWFLDDLEYSCIAEAVLEAYSLGKNEKL